MQNIPVFTSEFGVATLILKEIPYSGVSYIIIRDTQTPKEFTEECKAFCRAAGADEIFACGDTYLENYPFHTAIWQMTRPLEGLPDTDAALFPATEQTLENWHNIYNKAMSHVPNASYMTAVDAKQMLDRGDGYFVHRGDLLLGIGMASGDTIDAVVSVKPGAGQDVVLALAHAISDERVTLQVASTNTRAVRLYERMGFIKTSEISKWYKIF